VLAEKFGELLKGPSFDSEVLEWMTQALRHSHEDEKRFHDEAIGRLQGEYNRLQTRIDAMYVDKLDGLVSAAFFDRKAAEWRGEQDRIMRMVEEHQAANQNYLEEGVHLLELARRAHGLFERQEPREKRRLLNFILSNSTWKNGELVAEFRQPFDMLHVANQRSAGVEANAGGSGADFENWLPETDAVT
jgi:hypothetical protein